MSMACSWEAVPKIRERPPSMLKMSSANPLGGADRDLGAPIINAKKHRWWAPLGGSDGDPGASTINDKKYRHRVSWVAVPEIR
jgi:hypothetical protein